MAHLHRFFIDATQGVVDTVTLPEHEAHHALHVVRVKSGDEVALFDGAGAELIGRVTAAAKSRVQVAIESRLQHPLPSSDLTLIQAWLHRGDSVEELIRRCTEIGVRRFVFFRGQHSERSPQYNEKWVRWAVESCKQCGRFWLPRFEVAKDLSAAIALTPGASLAIATGAREGRPLGTLRGMAHVGVIVGPEGDFSSEEVESAIAAGAVPVSLGAFTYRAEVAAFLACSLVQYESGALGPGHDMILPT